MEEKDLHQIARAVRDTARTEDLTPVKDAIWRKLPLDTHNSSPKQSWLPVLATGACGVMAAVIAVALWLPGAPLAPTPAFAQVEKAMQEVQTAQWTETRYISEKNGAILRQSDKSFHYLRLGNTPLWVVTDRAGGVNAGYRNFNDGKTSLSAFPKEGRYQYVRSDARNPYVLNANASPAERLRTLILFPQDVNARSPAGADQTETRFDVPVTTSHSPWISTPDTLNNRDVLRWESTWTIRAAPHDFGKNNHYPGHTDKRTIRLWVNPATYHVVRREEITTGKAGTAQWRQVAENFQYNAVISSDIFALPTPPVGTYFAFMDFTQAGREASRPLAREKSATTRTIRQAVAAWNRHDASAFTRLWDLPYQKASADFYRGPSAKDAVVNGQQQWQRRALKGVPYVNWRVRNVRFEDCLNSLYVGRDRSTPFPPAERPTNFGALAEGEAQLKPGGAWVPADATFTLHRDGNHFGITWINMYKGKMLSTHGSARFK